MAAAITAAILLLTSCGGGAGSAAGDGGAGGTGTVTASTGTASAGTASAGTIGPPSSVPPTATQTASPTGSATTSAPPLKPPSGTGVYGYVAAGPTCPVERPDQPCPPRPVSARIEARDAQGATVESTQSDAEGRYALDLVAGDYTLVVVAPSAWPRCPDTPAAVRAGSATRTDISCDTGIR